METKSKINVRFGTSIARMNFLNCTIDVPMRCGGFCIASGCGSGKTTVIKDIIRQKWSEGILYTAATIRECNEMYDWIVKNLVGKILNNKVLSEDDIILLHSESNNGMDTLLENPEDISKKSIIICTHYKFLHEYPEILLKNDFNIRHWSNPQTGLRRAVTNTLIDGTMYIPPRQYVLIDEMPTCDMVKAKIEKPLMAILMKREVTNIVRMTNPEGKSVILNSKSVYSKYDDFELMESAYNEQAKGTSLSLRPETGKPIDEFRTRMPLEALYENFDIYNPDNEVKDVTVKYNITDLLLADIDTRFWLFDGTGDLTYGGSAKFSVRSVNKKYSSPVRFIKIPINSNRYIKGSYILNNEDNVLKQLDENCDQLIDLINKNGKTLIVTWKNLKVKESSYKKNPSIKLTVSSNNETFSIPQYYAYKICKKLDIPEVRMPDGSICTSCIRYKEKEFSIIHYQSGLDRATNQFRDYDSIIFYGEFIVPNLAISDFNSMYECNTNLLKYTTYQLVQAVCRTRIRNHKGEGINIYFTDDWDDEYMKFLSIYLTNSINWDMSDGSNTGLYSVTSNGEVQIEDTTLSHIPNKWKKVIIELSKYDPMLLESVRNFKSYSFNISLDNIFKLLPKAKKESRKYYPLINFFKSIGVNMTLI